MKITPGGVTLELTQDEARILQAVLGSQEQAHSNEMIDGGWDFVSDAYDQLAIALGDR